MEDEAIADRLLLTFPNVVEIAPGGSEKNKLGAARGTVAMLTSRWAPKQKIGWLEQFMFLLCDGCLLSTFLDAEAIREYAWGSALWEEFDA